MTHSKAKDLKNPRLPQKQSIDHHGSISAGFVPLLKGGEAFWTPMVYRAVPVSPSCPIFRGAQGGVLGSLRHGISGKCGRLQRKLSHGTNQWIGLRENLQETMVFTIKLSGVSG
jgi:hypothetical protein